MSGPADRSSLGGIFDMTGVTRGPDGIKRYAGLPANLVQKPSRAAARRSQVGYHLSPGLGSDREPASPVPPRLGRVGRPPGVRS